MSAFFPLNLTEDPSVSKKDLKEQHSRELQIEQAITKYQEVLKLQKNGEYIEAYRCYEELFKLEIISNHTYEEENFIKGLQNGGFNTIVDELSFISPNVKLLRYLIFRNRGMLYLELLKRGLVGQLCGEEENVTHMEKFTELFYIMIDNFCISLIYQEGDEKLLDILYELFIYLRAFRLAKFTLEYSLTGKSESDDILGLIPVNSQISVRYRWLRHLLHEIDLSGLESEKAQQEITRIDTKYVYLQPIMKDLQAQIETTKVLKIVEINLTKSMGWSNIIEVINGKVNAVQDKQREYPRSKSKYLDPYILTDTPLERFKFELVEEVVHTVPQEEPVVQGTLTETEESKRNDDAMDVDPPEHKENDEINEPNESTENSVNAPNESSEAKDEGSEVIQEKNSSPAPETSPSTEDASSKDAKDPPTEDTNEEAKVDENKVDASVEAPVSIASVAKEEEASRNKRQRASKRLAKGDALEEQPEIIVKREYFVETTKFFDNLQQFFNLLNDGNDNFNLQNIVNSYVPEDNEPRASYLNDFIQCLNDWQHPQYSKLLLLDESTSKTSDDEKVKLLNVLSGFAKSGLNRPERYDVPEISHYETPAKIREYLLSLNESENHYVDLKMKIISRLLGLLNTEDKKICLIADTVWPKNLSNLIRDWILQYETIMLQDFKSNFSSDMGVLAIAVGVHEILADTSMSMQQQISTNLTSKSQKYNKSTNSMTIELVKVRDSIRRWELFIQELLNIDFGDSEYQFILNVRYKWSKIHSQKSLNIYSKENKYAIIQLQELLEFAKSSGHELLVNSPNYENITEINLEIIKNQLTTLSVLDMFSRILNQSDSKNPEAIKLLEFILIGDDHSLTTDYGQHSQSFNQEAISAIKVFLDKSPVEMKLSLWGILFSYYSSSDKLIDFQLGFEQNLRFLMAYISGQEYITLSSSSRSSTLINILGFLGIHLQLFLSMLSKNNWDLPNSEVIPENFRISLRLFELFYTFSIHEEAALISSMKVSVSRRSSSSFQRLKDIFLRVVTLLVIYYKTYLFTKLGKDDSSKQNVADLLSVVHEQLGVRQVCGSSKGLFLKMAQEILISLGCHSSKNDLAQLTGCRYHFNITIDNYTPKNHATETQEQLNETSTKELARFILPYCFNKNPLINIPKHDTKLIIDGFYDVIGNPKFEPRSVLTRNLAVLDEFIDCTVITPRFMRDAFYGLLEMDFEEPEPNKEIIKLGLYYLEAVLIFSSYKVKKKNSQSRVVDLENIIQLLKNDLIYCSDRVESWYLLGQAYGYLVEDDLIWTADKLISTERKIQTANLQRKSLICYLLAINGTIKNKDENNKQFMKPVVGILMSAFAKELYGACMMPMEMHAFKVQMFPKFVHNENGDEFVSVASKSSVSVSLCLKIIQQALHLSIKADPDDWTNYYYLSKTQKKLNKDPKLVLETMLTASNLAFKQSALPERIIEPHYTICSLVYKYFKQGKLSFEDALLYYKADPVIDISENASLLENKSDKGFYEIVVKALKKVDTYDKKHWHHKPRYRLSKVLFEEFGNSKEAIEQMSTLISVKASSKTLVSIWKPDNERPGKHFYYTFQYAKFFIQLLAHNNDLANLVHMFPRLRRSNSIMIKLYTAWESICSSVCRIVRKSIGIDSSFFFTDNFMQKLVYSTFMPKSKSYIEKMSKEGIPKVLEPHMCYLFALNDMKKFNSGFGPTSFIDDTIVAIYFKFYIHYDEDNSGANGDLKGSTSGNSTNTPAVTDSPSAKIKKIAKRDIFPFTTEILKNNRREIENILKDNPDIYNTFVKDALAKMEQEKNEKEKSLLSSTVDIKTEGEKEDSAAIKESLSEKSQIEDESDEKEKATKVIHYTSFPIMPNNILPTTILNSTTDKEKEIIDSNKDNNCNTGGSEIHVRDNKGDEDEIQIIEERMVSKAVTPEVPIKPETVAHTEAVDDPDIIEIEAPVESKVIENNHSMEPQAEPTAKSTIKSEETIETIKEEVNETKDNDNVDEEKVDGTKMDEEIESSKVNNGKRGASDDLESESLSEIKRTKIEPPHLESV